LLSIDLGGDFLISICAVNHKCIESRFDRGIRGAVRLGKAGVVLIGIALLCGCSGFNRAWREAGKQPAPRHSMLGRWEGQWLSEVNGHNGALRCIVTETSNGVHHARFRATYLKVLKFSYTVPLTVTESNGVWQFAGQEDLGTMAGGVYGYEGSATSNEFHSTYRSEHDHGTFDMQRPQSED